MEKRRKLLYSDIEGNVMDIMAYIRQLEKERDDALRQVEEWNEDDAVFDRSRDGSGCRKCQQTVSCSHDNRVAADNRFALRQVEVTDKVGFVENGVVAFFNGEPHNSL